MIKILLTILALSCSKSVNELRTINKGLNEDLIRYCKEGDKQKIIECINKGADVNFKDEEGNTPLFYAIRFKFEDEAEILLIAGADIHFKDKSGNISLLYAVLNYQNKIARLLIEKGSDINFKGYKGLTILMHALFTCNREIFSLMIKKGANIYELDDQGKSVLEYALEKEDLALIIQLMRAGANFKNEQKEKIDELINKKIDIHFKDELNKSALDLAVERGEVEIARLLIEKGADINHRRINGYSAFINAAWYGNKELVKLLLEKGANINERGHNNNSALIEALRGKREKMAKLLIRKGAFINDKDSSDGTTVLMYAIKNYYLEMAKSLIEEGVNINDKDNYYVTTLMYALKENSIEIAKLLIEKGAEVNSVDMSNNSVLIYAIETGDINISRLLIDRGLDLGIQGTNAIVKASEKGNIYIMNLLLENVDINSMDTRGNIALIDAASNCRIDSLKFLLEKGANVNATNSYNNTALIEVCKKFDNNKNYEAVYETIIELLLENGANVNYRGGSGCTALNYAVRGMNNKKIVKMLLNAKADVNHKDDNNNTPLIQALGSDLKIVRLLIKRGASIDAIGKFGFTALMAASNCNNLDIIKTFVELGANINYKNNNYISGYRGYTSLSIALERENIDVAKFLIESGANLDEVNFRGDGALMFIIKKIEGSSSSKNIVNSKDQYIELLRIALKKSTNINYKNKNSISSCLYYTFSNDNIEIIKEIISVGTSIYEKDLKGTTVLAYNSEKIRNCKDKLIKDEYIKIAYMIIKKMAEDYIHLFISLNKNLNTPQKAKDEVNNNINMLYSLQKLPKEIFIEVITRF